MKYYAHRVNAGRPPKAPGTPTLQLKGQRFGHLVVLDYINCAKGKSWWSCQCDCGQPGSQIIVRSDKLTGGQTRACKCRMGYKKPGVETGTKMPRLNPPAVRLTKAGSRLTTPAPPVRPKLQPDPLQETEGPPAIPAPGRPPYCKDASPEKLAAAELLSARQMARQKFSWVDIADYLAIGRAGGCTIDQAKKLVAIAA